MTSSCRSCGKPIIWAVTPAGKKIPVDVEPVFGGNIALDRDHVDGEMHATFDKPGQRRLYKSHFATCPKAETHRTVARGKASLKPRGRAARAEAEQQAYERAMRGEV
jgi:hypothetical protein